MKNLFYAGKSSLVPFLALASGLFLAAPAEAGRDAKVTNGSNFTVIYRPGYGLFGSGTNGSSYLLGVGVTTASFTNFQTISTTETWTHLESVNARTYAIHADSTLWGWGSGATNAFGNNSTANLTVPTQINTDHWIALTPNVTAASARAIRSDSTLWAWGSNTSSSYLGDGTSTTRPTPVQIGGNGSKWLDVSSISGHTLAVKSDSTLWAWGNNNSGQFGNGTTSGTATSTPAQIGTAKWIRVCAGDLRSFAIKSDSTLWASGSNGSGLLGLGVTTGNQTTFAQVGTGKWIKLVYGRSTVMALKADSTLWTWGAAGSTTGASTYGVFGQGTKYSDSIPSQIGTSKWRDFFIGASDVIAQDNAGDYWAWGKNSSGAFGNGTSGTNNWSTTPSRIYPGLASQTITFGALTSKTYGDADFDPGATASSGLTVSYASSDPAVATIVSGKIHIVGPGTATITASQAGSSSYMAAADVAQSLTVGQASQTITFGALASKTYGDADFSLGATASSGLTVAYASSDPSVATVSGSTVTVVGAGTTTITASQAGGANHLAATDVAQSLTVGKASQTLAFPALASKTLGDADFAPGATASSGLTVAYASSDPAVATIVSGQIHIVGAGTATITASQAGDANYLAAPDSSLSLTVAKTPQSITFGALSAKTYGDASFVLAATAGSGLTVSYASSDPSVATVSGSTVTIVGAGSADITASQAGNAHYAAAADVVRALTVGKASQTLSFPALSAKSTGDADFAPGASASSALAVSYASSNPSVATIVSGQIHIVGTGTTVITASQAGNANYLAAPDSALTLTVNASQASQTITFNALAAKTFGDAAFTLTATASSNLAVSYASSDPSVATVSGSTVTLIGAGTTTITASQAGNGSYSAAADVARSLTVGKAAQTLTFNALAQKSVGDADFAPGASASSGLTVAYASSDASVATIVAGQIHIVGPGTATITASQAGNGNYHAAADAQQSLSVKAGQSISFAAPAAKTFGDADFAPGATATSGLSVTYASSDTLVARIVAGQIRIVGAGTATITASQAGNGAYHAASDVARTLTVGKAAQTLTFNALAQKSVGDADFAPGASASSGLPVAYASSDASVATIVAGQIHIVGPGTATITASQAGDANRNAATAQQTLTVVQNQTLVFNPLADKTYGDADFDPGAVAVSGHVLSYASSNPAVATVAAGKIHIVGAGVTVITASQAIGSNPPDTSAVRTLTVNKAAQALSFGPLADKTFGDADFAPGAVAGSGLTPSYASSDSAVAAIVDGKIHLVGSGTAVITASQAGDGNHLAAPSVAQTLTVSRAAQTLAFQLGSDSLKTEGDAAFRLIAVSSAGLAARFSSSDTAVAKVRGDSAWVIGVGTAVLTASQDGDSRFAAAAPVTRTIRVRTAPPPAIDASRIPASPKEGTGSTVELDWPAPARATGYRFQASVDTSAAPRLDTLLSHKGFTLAGLVPGSAHFWRVAAVNGPSEGAFTPWFGFHVRLQDESGVSRGAVIDSTEPVKLSGIVSVAAKSGGAPAITVTVTEEKKAPANMPAGFVSLTGSISLAAVSGGTTVGDSQLIITLNRPDTSLDGRPLDPADVPLVYTLDSATGALEAVFDLERDSEGRIVFPLSKGKSFLLAVDTIPPAVRDSTPSEIRQAGNAPVISGIVDDNIRNCRTTLYYRQGSSDTFDSVSVAVDASGRFELPLDLELDSTGFEYHLTANDGRNLKRTPATNMPIEVKVIRSADSLPTLQWRLFALPTLPGDFQWSGLAADLGVYGKDWKLFIRAGEGLREFGEGLDKAEAGRAYWLKSRRGFLPKLAAGVTAPIDKPFEIVLPPKGWVSFGNPFLFPVAWQSVLDSTHAPSGALLGPYTYRDTAWVAPLEVPALLPWEGYYAYNASEDTVRMRVPARKARSLEPLLARTAFHLQWQVRGPDGKDGGNIFGGLGAARPGTALGKAAAAAAPAPVWRFPKPEAPDAGLRAGFLSEGNAAGLLQTDFHAVGSEAGLAWTARLTGLRSGQRYVNRLEGFDRLPEGMAVAVADAATGSFVPWNADQAYVVEAQAGEASRDLRFFAGSPEYVASMGKVFTAAHPFALELGNYPNPVRTSTLVHFTVPASAAERQHVRIAVYDMQGRMVKLLTEGPRTTGRYSLRWDARDGKGKILPAGSYRLLLQVGAKKRNRAVQIF